MSASAPSAAEGGGAPLKTILVALAVTAAAFRLIPLQWLHPLNWDELEFFHAARWIAEGRVPFRDFWEHHTPLAWLLFAPFTLLTDSPGVGAVIALRWAQIPVWIATFFIANRWMRGARIGATGRWGAMALALSSAFFMLPAIEYRVDSVSCMLFAAGLLLAQRGWMFLAGVLFCLVGFANVRLGPLLVVTVLLLRVVTPDAIRWGGSNRTNRLFAGGVVMLLIALGVFAATDSLMPLYRQVWVENTYEQYVEPVRGSFLHRVLIPFGIRLIGPQRPFDPAAIDVGGAAILVLGFIGLVRALLTWRTPGHLFLVAVLQVTNLLFIASMKFVYNYHFLIVVVLMLPLVAVVIESMRALRPWLIALVTVAWAVNAFGSVFRGKELDRAYQDRVMREVHARTKPDDVVWSGIPWTLRREPAYRFWFLPELARTLVRRGMAPRYHLDDMMANPPGAIVFDHNALVWVVTVQRELAPWMVRHYTPVWRDLWIPAMNARLLPNSRPFVWITPRDGDYRLYASPALAAHPWFRNPLLIPSSKHEGFPVRLPPPAGNPDLTWSVDGQRVAVGRVLRLRKGQRVSAATTGREPMAVFLIPTDDRLLFRHPPPSVSIEGEALRVTHIPQIGARIEP